MKLPLSKVSLQLEIEESALTEAAPVLTEANLTVAGVLQSVLRRIAKDGYVSLNLFSPDAETIEAMEELNRGETRSFPDVESLMADLHSDD